MKSKLTANNFDRQVSVMAAPMVYLSCPKWELLLINSLILFLFNHSLIAENEHDLTGTVSLKDMPWLCVDIISIGYVGDIRFRVQLHSCKPAEADLVFSLKSIYLI